MKQLKRFFHGVLFTALTLRLPGWVNKVFSRICCLDWPNRVTLELGFLRGAGNTVDFEPVDGRRFVIAEDEEGRLNVREEHLSAFKGVLYKEVYRQGEFIKSVRWAWKLKQLHRHMKKYGVYLHREKELLKEMKEGQITTTMM